MEEFLFHTTSPIPCLHCLKAVPSQPSHLACPAETPEMAPAAPAKAPGGGGFPRRQPGIASIFVRILDFQDLDPPAANSLAKTAVDASRTRPNTIAFEGAGTSRARSHPFLPGGSGGGGWGRTLSIVHTRAGHTRPHLAGLRVRVEGGAGPRRRDGHRVAAVAEVRIDGVAQLRPAQRSGGIVQPVRTGPLEVDHHIVRAGPAGGAALHASGPRPARVRFFEFYRAARVRSASAAVSPNRWRRRCARACHARCCAPGRARASPLTQRGPGQPGAAVGPGAAGPTPWHHIRGGGGVERAPVQWPDWESRLEQCTKRWGQVSFPANSAVPLGPGLLERCLASKCAHARPGGCTNRRQGRPADGETATGAGRTIILQRNGLGPDAEGRAPTHSAVSPQASTPSPPPPRCVRPLPQRELAALCSTTVADAWTAVAWHLPKGGRFCIQGSQDSGAGVARAWRGRGAGYTQFFGLGGAGVARAWRGRGAGMSCDPRGKGLRFAD
eukprot:gene23747-biopygen19359